MIDLEDPIIKSNTNIAEISFDKKDTTQNFYKYIGKGVAGNLAIVHGYKLCKILRS